MALPNTTLSLGLQLLLLLDLAVLILAATEDRLSTGVRVQNTDIFRGAIWTAQLMHGHEKRMHNMVRMRPAVFVKLANELRDGGFVQDSNLLGVEEKLLIFLLVFAANDSYRKVGEETQHSLATIHA